MSQGARISIFILLAVMIAAVGYAGWTTLENVNIKKDKQRIEKELVEAQNSEKKALQELAGLKDQVKKLTEEKNKIDQEYQDAKGKMDGVTAKVKEITDDRDRWQNMVETARKERDELMAKVQELSTRQAELTSTKPPEPAKVDSQEEQKAPDTTTELTQVPDGENTEYWADILKQKATLEVELQKMKEDLSKSSIQLVDLKQKNADLQLQLDNLYRAKDVVGVETKYKEELVNNLSLELARAKNDKKYLADKFTKLNMENEDLRKQLQQLINAKSILEKSIVQLTQDKDKMQGELGKAETLVQSKIDEIWEIKDSLDKTIQSNKTPAASNHIELPPIIVNSPGQTPEYNVPIPTGVNGKIISINEENNFVILNLGENSGVKVGEVLGIYRGDKYIARVEIIQVRKDIAAADLKDQWAKVKVNDAVR